MSLAIGFWTMPTILSFGCQGFSCESGKVQNRRNDTILFISVVTYIN